MKDINLDEVRVFQEKLRSVFPIENGMGISNEYLSAGFRMLTELIVLRIVQDIQQREKRHLSAQEVRPITETVHEALNKGFSDAVLKYIPDATLLRAFTK